jgi:hypothetical protein
MRYTSREIKKLRSDAANDLPWDDLRVPMQNTRINPTKSEPAFEEWIDGIYAYRFEADNDAEESLHFSAQIPHGYAEGTALRPHLHWAPSSTDTGDVVWEFEYVYASVDETFQSSAINSTKTQAAGGVADHHQLVEFDPIPGDQLRISAMIHCRLTRLGDDGDDTFTGDAIPLEFDFHYQKDSDGSYHEYDKLTDDYRKQKGNPKVKFRPGAW